MDALLLLHPIEKAIGREDKDRGDYFLDAGGKARHRGGRALAEHARAGLGVPAAAIASGGSGHRRPGTRRAVDFSGTAAAKIAAAGGKAEAIS